MTAPAAVAVSLVLAAPGAAAVTVGSDLGALPSATEGLCALPGSGAGSCTEAQASLATTHLASGGLTAPAAGTILRWRVRSAAASAGTTAVKLRLLVLDGNVAKGDASPWVELPLAEPGTHSFSARLPVEKGDRLAVETRVSGNGAGPAFAPIAHFGPDVGSLDEWIFPATPGLRLPPDSTSEGVELLLNAEIDTDRTPPRTKLTYPQRQDFLATKEVLVRFRCNEDATAFASGQLEFPNGKRGSVIYGLYGKQRRVEGGEKTALRLRLPRKTWEAALRAHGNGKRIVVKVTVSAEDPAGNRSGTTVAAIRPQR